MWGKETLRKILWAKVGFTLIAWALPLLLLTPSGLKGLGIREPPPPLFAHLLGAAYLALTLCYLQGIRELDQPGATAASPPVRGVVRVGIASNALASLLLLSSGLRGEWAGWTWPAPLLLWGSALVTGCIATGLVVCEWRGRYVEGEDWERRWTRSEYGRGRRMD